MKLRTILNEIQSGTFQMYHGGSKWSGEPEIRPTKGRYEGGTGIYFTTNYETARKYAKGSNVVQIVDIASSFTDLKTVKVDIDSIFEFLDSLGGLKKRKELKSDIQRFADRIQKKEIPLTVLNNLIINWEAGSGEIGKEVARFFVSNGADAVIDDQSGDEQWLIVFNPKIIKNYKVTNPKEIETYMLPKIK